MFPGDAVFSRGPLIPFPSGEARPETSRGLRSANGARGAGPAANVLQPPPRPAPPLHSSRPSGLQPLSFPAAESLNRPHPHSPPAASTAYRPSHGTLPSSPRGGADFLGCHVSLMTSPGPLGLSQSARGSPSKVLASESAGRGAGRSGGRR